MFEVEFLVVGNGRMDGLRRLVLILRIVELVQVRVFQNLGRCRSFTWIELEHLGDQVDGIGRSFVLKPLLDRLDLYEVDRADHRYGHFRVQGNDVLLGRFPCEGENPFELIESGVSWEHRLTDQHLSQNAPNAPNVC